MHTNNTYYFEQAPVGRAISHFGVPTLIGMLVLILYNLVDTFFIGLLGNYNMLSGVALAMTLFIINMGIGVFFGIGCGSYISRLLGRKDYEAVRSRDFRLKGEIIRATSAIGFPVFLLELITIATSLTLNNLAAGYGACTLPSTG